MNPIISAVGELLYENRAENGLSQQEMAAKCNLNENDYIGFETGSIAIPLHTFFEICRICKINTLSFFKKCIQLSSSVLTKADSVSYVSEGEIFESEKGSQYTAYNVVVKQGETILTRYSDVFFNKEAAQHFVDMCNRLELDPLHVADVIDDVIIK